MISFLSRSKNDHINARHITSPYPEPLATNPHPQQQKINKLPSQSHAFAHFPRTVVTVRTTRSNTNSFALCPHDVFIFRIIPTTKNNAAFSLKHKLDLD